MEENWYETMNPLIVRKTDYGAGKGVYAGCFFMEGEKLFIFSEEIVSWTKATHRSIQLGRNRWLNPAPESYGHYLNHSCAPSCVFVLPNKIVALRDLRKDEELTIDYSTVVHTPKWEMECCCTAADCRKLIKSFPLMSFEFREKYKGWSSWEEF